MAATSRTLTGSTAGSRAVVVACEGWLAVPIEVLAALWATPHAGSHGHGHHGSHHGHHGGSSDAWVDGERTERFPSGSSAGSSTTLMPSLSLVSPPLPAAGGGGTHAAFVAGSHAAAPAAAKVTALRGVTPGGTLVNADGSHRAMPAMPLHYVRTGSSSGGASVSHPSGAGSAAASASPPATSPTVGRLSRAWRMFGFGGGGGAPSSSTSSSASASASASSAASEDCTARYYFRVEGDRMCAYVTVPTPHATPDGTAATATSPSLPSTKYSATVGSTLAVPTVAPAASPADLCTGDGSESPPRAASPAVLGGTGSSSGGGGAAAMSPRALFAWPLLHLSGVAATPSVVDGFSLDLLPYDDSEARLHVPLRAPSRAEADRWVGVLRAQCAAQRARQTRASSVSSSTPAPAVVAAVPVAPVAPPPPMLTISRPASSGSRSSVGGGVGMGSTASTLPIPAVVHSVQFVADVAGLLSSAPPPHSGGDAWGGLVGASGGGSGSSSFYGGGGGGGGGGGSAAARRLRGCTATPPVTPATVGDSAAAASDGGGSITALLRAESNARLGLPAYRGFGRDRDATSSSGGSVSDRTSSHGGGGGGGGGGRQVAPGSPCSLRSQHGHGVIAGAWEDTPVTPVGSEGGGGSPRAVRLDVTAAVSAGSSGCAAHSASGLMGYSRRHAGSVGSVGSAAVSGASVGGMPAGSRYRSNRGSLDAKDEVWSPVSTLDGTSLPARGLIVTPHAGGNAAHHSSSSTPAAVDMSPLGGREVDSVNMVVRA